MYYLNEDTIRTKLAIVDELAAAHRTTLELNTELDKEATARRDAEIANKGLRANHAQALRDLKDAQEAIEAQEQTLAAFRYDLNDAREKIAGLEATVEGLNAHAFNQAQTLADRNSLLETQRTVIEFHKERAHNAEATVAGLNAHAFNQGAELAKTRMRNGVLETTLITRNDQIKNACDKIAALRDQLDLYATLNRRGLVEAVRDINTELAIEPTDEPMIEPWGTLLTILEPFVQALRAADPALDLPQPPATVTCAYGDEATS